MVNFFLSPPGLAIDLGTANTLILVKGKGIVLRQPSVVVRHKKTKEVIAVGERAKKMIGKTPALLEVVFPLKDGVVADYDALVGMLDYFMKESMIEKNFLSFIFKPLVVVGVPTGITEVEKKAVVDAVKTVGGGEVILVEEPIADALGIGLPVKEIEGSLLVDIGGGTTEIALLSLGGIVLNRCLKLAGEEMDEAIANFVRLKYSLLLGKTTAEEIKIQLGTVIPEEKPRQMVVRGRDLGTGLPKTVKISSSEVMEAISPIIREILLELQEIIEEAPPELMNDVVSRGIVLTGGGSQIKGLDKLIAEETKMPVWVAEDPLTSVVRGCGKILENPSAWRVIK
ncbi:MAG: rod shape-determining protein [Microgenomates group bacterium]